MIKPKSRGAGIFDEHQEFLAFNAEEFENAKQSNPNILIYAHRFLEYGGSREGY